LLGEGDGTIAFLFADPRSTAVLED
jgi:hypothetical protein